MGLGGHLMWTPIIKGLKRQNPKRKIVLVKSSGRRFDRDDLKYKHSRMRDLESSIFYNNPHLSKLSDVGDGDIAMYLDLVLRDYSYYAEVNKRKVTFWDEGHAIDILGRNYGFKKVEKRCELFLTYAEKQKVSQVSERFGPFITIEPHSKDSFTPNKCWGFDDWQKVVDRLSPEFTIVQISMGGELVLKGVKDLTGMLSFREACGVISRSALFLSAEGGLVHAANAARTKAVVVYTGWQPLRLTSYVDNINLYPSVDCAPCGLLEACPKGFKCAKCVTPDMVIAEVNSVMRNEEV